MYFSGDLQYLEGFTYKLHDISLINLALSQILKINPHDHVNYDKGFHVWRMYLYIGSQILMIPPCKLNILSTIEYITCILVDFGLSWFSDGCRSKFVLSDYMI